MRKVEATILLVLLLVFGGIVYLEFCVPKQTQVVHGPAIRIVEKEFDTLRIIKSKYKTLHDTQTIIQSKYETLFVFRMPAQLLFWLWLKCADIAFANLCHRYYLFFSNNNGSRKGPK